jgi:hypothetical protein
MQKVLGSGSSGRVWLSVQSPVLKKGQNKTWEYVQREKTLSRRNGDSRERDKR